MRRIRELFSLAADTEVTVEALPNRVDASWMVAFQNTGVNRLVLGLATARIPELERIGSANNMPSSETSLILPQLFHLPGYEATLLYGIRARRRLILPPACGSQSSTRCLPCGWTP